MYGDSTRAQSSLTVTWCKKRKRVRENIACEPSRFIKEMRIEDGDALPDQEAEVTPQDRLANLKALLQKPKAA